MCCTDVATAAAAIILDEALSHQEHQTEGILSVPMVMPYFAPILFLLHCTDVATAAIEINHEASCLTFNKSFIIVTVVVLMLQGLHLTQLHFATTYLYK